MLSLQRLQITSEEYEALMFFFLFFGGGRVVAFINQTFDFTSKPFLGSCG